MKQYNVAYTNENILRTDTGREVTTDDFCCKAYIY